MTTSPEDPAPPLQAPTPTPAPDPLPLLTRARCPRCGAMVEGGADVCAACGLSMRGVSLYNPSSFPWLAVLFSAVVPIFMAASNWGKWGKPGTKRWWLIGGVGGYMLVFAIMVLLGDRLQSSLVIGVALNLPVALRLKSTQRPMYDSALRMGAVRGSTLKGALIGFGLTVLAIAVPLCAYVGAMVKLTYDAEVLMDAGRYTDALAKLSVLHRLDPEDEDVLYSTALCHTLNEDWDKASQAWSAYLSAHARDARAHAFLGFVEEKRGRRDEAQRHYKIAEDIDPGILEKVFSHHGDEPEDVRPGDVPRGDA